MLGARPASRKGLWFGVAGGAVLVGLGIVILMSPPLLFVLGGGGNVERFNEQMAGINTTGVVVMMIGVLVTALSVMLHSLRLRRARHGAADNSAAGHGPGAYPGLAVADLNWARMGL